MQSEIGNLLVFQLQLELVRDQCDELRIGGFAFCVGNRISEESLQGIQVAPIPSYLDGVTDGPFHPGGGGLECLCHLRIQYFRNGVDGVPAAHQMATAATVL